MVPPPTNNPIQVVGVIGLGYVGQTLVGAFANVGYQVVGIDIDESKISLLNSTYTPTIFEPELGASFKAHQTQISFTTKYDQLMSAADAICITVGTPVSDEGVLQIEGVNAVVSAIVPHLREGQLIILRSTVSPGTTRKVAEAIEASSGYRIGNDIYVAFCPERTIEGAALAEHHDVPVIVGGVDPASTQRCADLMLRLGPQVIQVSSAETAELCKLIDNTYRAQSIAFANQIGSICEVAGIDSYEAVNAVNTAYPRTRMFRPGLGAGGPCLSKDPAILHAYAASLGSNANLLKAGIDMNRQSTARIKQFITEFVIAEKIDHPVVATLGVAFKGHPETDDARSTPAAIVSEAINELQGSGTIAGGSIRYCDPLVREYNGQSVISSIEDALSGANIVLFMNDHKMFCDLEVELVLRDTARPLLIVDAWHNVRNPKSLQEHEQVRFLRLGDGS